MTFRALNYKIYNMLFRKEGLNLVNLSLNDRTSQSLFNSAIRDSGQVAMFVHPFYLEELMSEIREDGLPEYREKRGLMLSSRSRDDIPLIIFEPVGAYEEFEVMLKNMRVKGLVFTIMTPAHQPVPMDPEAMQNPRLIDALQKDLIKKLPPALEERCWGRLAGLLSGKQVSLGGQWLTHHEDEDFTEPDAKARYESKKEVLTKTGVGSLTDKNGEKLQKLPGYCVGMTALELAARNINVALSLPTWPNVNDRILNYLLEKYFPAKIFNVP